MGSLMLLSIGGGRLSIAGFGMAFILPIGLEAAWWAPPCATLNNRRAGETRQYQVGATPNISKAAADFRYVGHVSSMQKNKTPPG